MFIILEWWIIFNSKYKPWFGISIIIMKVSVEIKSDDTVKSYLHFVKKRSSGYGGIKQSVNLFRNN